MKQITVYSNEFSVPDNSYTFLSKYLDRIRNFINSNSLDIDLLNDIEERISERFFSIIENSQEIQEKDIIDIVNEIWEPEDIFKDFTQKREDNNSNSSNFSSKVKDTLKAKLYKNSKKWVILWVCQWFWEYFEINPIWIRILFLFLFFFYWTWILIYIILWIILPEKDELESDVNIEKNIHKTAERVKEVANQGFVINFFNAMGRFIIAVFNICSRFVGFFFFWILWLIMIFSWIMWVVASAFINNQYVINNESLFSYVPTYFVTSSLVFSIIIFVLWIVAIFGAFNKKLINWYIILTSFIILAISWFWITSWVFKTASNYINVYSKTENYDLWEANTWSVIKLSSINNLARNNNFLHIDYDRITLKVIKSDSNKINMELISNIRANNNFEWTMVLKNINSTNISLKDNEIIFSWSSNTFSNVVPFSFLTRELIIKLPVDVSLDLRNLFYRDYELDNSIMESEEMIKYDVYWCYNSIIKYDISSNQFICNDIDWINREKSRAEEEN